MKRKEKVNSKILHSAFISFLPLGAVAIHFIYQTIPLRWALLASLLKITSLLSLFSNAANNDLLWSFFAIYAYILFSSPAYFDTLTQIKNKNHNDGRGLIPEKVVFSELFKKVYRGVFSDYKISLMAKIPLALQLLAAGSIIYSIFGLDWIIHSMAGFGIGAVSLKAYKIATKAYGYNKLASYFGISKFKPFKTERKSAAAEWTLFCLVVVTVVWEILEYFVYYLSPYNPLRFRSENLWNSVGDVIFGILGGMTAYTAENKFLKSHL
ncbi:MAG: hypothetical protein QXN87_09080 [Candidatus Bathyarchaeia archaeon]